jgi:putative serine protease PepD
VSQKPDSPAVSPENDAEVTSDAGLPVSKKPLAKKAPGQTPAGPQNADESVSAVGPVSPGGGKVSPFAPSVYQGVSDSYTRQRLRALEEDKKRARTLGSFVTVALVVGALLGGTAGGAFAIWNLSSRGLVTPGVSTPATITVNAPLQASEITAVASSAMPSVVTIEVAGTAGGGSGSGVIVSEDGYVMTNAHVVSIGSEEPIIRVTLSDGRIFEATVVGRDVLSDIAVIKLASEGPFSVMELGDSDSLNVGDQVIAIGAPLFLPGTVTSGIVSAINRSITIGASEVPGEEDGQFDFDVPGGGPELGQSISIPVIQTDASINPGNSGGALLNREGELIGVNVAIASTGGQSAGSIGLGFSIPANYAARVAAELIQTGRASHGLLGALVTDAQSMENARLTGAYIDSVSPGGAAAQSGIRAGDVVTMFNGIPITNRVDLTAQVRTLRGGASSTMTYVRGGNTYTVEVTLGELE